jgi:hypothetical protein
MPAEAGPNRSVLTRGQECFGGACCRATWNVTQIVSRTRKLFRWRRRWDEVEMVVGAAQDKKSAAVQNSYRSFRNYFNSNNRY